MKKPINSDEKPLVGFINLFYNFGETCRSVLIAKRFIELGGNVIFFSHGGRYEYLAEKIGCKVVRIKPIYTEKYIDLLWKSSRLTTFRNPFSKRILKEHIEEEVAAFKKNKVKLIVSTNNWPCYLSARIAKIPLIAVTPKLIFNYKKFPEDANILFFKLFPKSIKLKFLNWYSPRSKMYIRPFIKIAKKYNIPSPKPGGDLAKGDYTLYVDFAEFLDIDKSSIPPNEYYTGHHFLDELYEKNLSEAEIEKEERLLKKHIDKEGKSILFSLGSSGTKKNFIQILKALDKTKYNVIAIYTSVVNEEDLPEVNNNILLKKFVPSMKKLNKMVDLAIIHGGKATVYTAAYSGKPAICFPMQFEQHLNIEALEKHGMAIMLSRKNFNEQQLLNTIDHIFNNYDFYLKNARILSQKLPSPEGDKNAAKKILEILEKEKFY